MLKNRTENSRMATYRIFNTLPANLIIARRIFHLSKEKANGLILYFVAKKFIAIRSCSCKLRNGFITLKMPPYSTQLHDFIAESF